MVRTTSPSSPMRMKAFGAKLVEAALLWSGGSARLNNRPPPTAAVPARKPRRDRLVSSRREVTRSEPMSASLCGRLRGKLDRLADAHISSTAADVATHGLID